MWYGKSHIILIGYYTVLCTIWKDIVPSLQSNILYSGNCAVPITLFRQNKILQKRGAIVVYSNCDSDCWTNVVIWFFNTQILWLFWKVYARVCVSVIWEKRGRACENSHGTLWSRFRFFSFLFLYLSFKLKTKPIQLRDRPFNLKWGAWFFAKKNDLMLNFEKKNTFAGMGTEKIIWDSKFTI